VTAFPANGFSLPCSPTCAEFNAKGCPGTSPHCVDRWTRAEAVGERLAALIDDYAAEVTHLVENYVGRPERDDLLRTLQDHTYATAHGINAVRDVAADAHALSKHLRVIEDAA
jgi:hypothetical protein